MSVLWMDSNAGSSNRSFATVLTVYANFYSGSKEQNNISVSKDISCLHFRLNPPPRCATLFDYHNRIPDAAPVTFDNLEGLV